MHTMNHVCVTITVIAVSVTTLLDADEPGNAPESRAHHQLVYHAGEGRAYLIGGSTPGEDGYRYFDDIWYRDGDGWQPAGSLPFPRSSHRVVHHAGRDTLVLFGGRSRTDEGFRDHHDTWVLRENTWQSLR